VKPQYGGFYQNKGPEVRVKSVSGVSVKPGPWALIMLRETMAQNVTSHPITENENLK
jgi:hypothetical protein